MTEVMNGPSAGALLRQARESAGLHVAALAVALKVPVRKLEALEDDRYDELPDAVFARALASSVCRSLKVDPQPILERLPQTAAPRLIPSEGRINAPFRAPGETAGANWLNQLNRPVFLAVFALLLGALVLIFLPTAREEAAAVAAPSDAPEAPLAAPVVLEPAADAAPVAPAGAPTPEPATALAEPPVVGVAAAQAPSAMDATAVVPAAAAAAAPAASGVVVFRTTGPSWIEVTDARGAVALRRLMEAGEAAGVSGALPLTVTVGSAGATAVEVRGQRFDLAPVTRDNVARFEVK